VAPYKLGSELNISSKIKGKLPKSTFVEKLHDIIERAVVYDAPLIMVGDPNVHLDQPQALNSSNMVSLRHDFNLVQHTTGSIHNKGHTLDVFITQRTTSVSVHADPPVISINMVITTGSEQVIRYHGHYDG